MKNFEIRAKLQETADTVGKLNDSSIDYYFLNGKEIGFIAYPGTSAEIGMEISREWGESLLGILEYTKLK